MSVAVKSVTADQAPLGEGADATSSNSLAALIQRVYTQEYAEARHQYHASHARFSARVKRAPPSWLDRYCAAAFRDLSFYTCAPRREDACETSACTHGPRRIGAHALNRELRLSALDRLHATPEKAGRGPGDVAALLVSQEAAEHACLVALEAASFLRVARAYYDQMIGPFDELVWLESQARRDVEDEYHHATMALLAELREEMWVAEQRLFLRALGMCPEALPHASQRRLMEAEARALALAQSLALDSRDAVPLWHRVCAIRGETESEEDINFKRLELACIVQMHGLRDGYLRYDTITGRLRHTYREVPACMQDVVGYALQFETFTAVLAEESGRMRLAEEAEQAYAALMAELHPPADEAPPPAAAIAAAPAPASTSSPEPVAADTA
ncbi:hypothetical protein NESM_000427700 [Novymonas esmeraldas]|uniref:Uncharacterized protein n=1 Tax=Novymonas esmeraldas TaxID=1808958 RepID=A0AAW0ENU7_9TRYP